MSSEADNKSLPYGLCAVAASALICNAALLVWHCLRVRAPPSGRHAKHAFSCVTATYTLIALALILLTVYTDSASVSLCKVAGFLTLFSSQASLWFLAMCTLILLLWIRMRRESVSYSAFVSNRWNLPIFVLAAIVISILLIVVSILPMTNVDYFDKDLESNLFLCVPLQVPHHPGWGYSTLVLLLDWIALIITIISCVFCLIKIQTFGHMDPVTKASPYAEALGQDMLLKWVLLVVLGVSAILWTLALTILSVTYWSGGNALTESNTRWGLGYMVAFLLLAHPGLALLVHLLLRRAWGPRNGDQSEALLAQSRACPGQLEAIQKLANTWQREDLSQYLVQWRGPLGETMSGVMKVYHPSSLSKYRAEVIAAARIATTATSRSPLHPNIATYHWYSAHNPFSTTIADLTADSISVESGVICKAYYPSGTLHQLLRTRVQQIDDAALYKLTADMAAGLDFLHGLGIAHNALSTNCVYMASVSQKIGLNAVIGDFEHSKMLATASRQSGRIYNISQATADAERTAHFAPDVRAFGVIVLEMLVSVSEYHYKRRTRKVSTGSMHSTSDTASVHTGLSAKSTASASVLLKTQDNNSGIQDHSDKLKSISEQHNISFTSNKITSAVDSIHDKASLTSAGSLESPRSLTSRSLAGCANTPNVARIQQRALPPIPIEKVVEDVQSCASGLTSNHDSERLSIHSQDSSAFSPKPPARRQELHKPKTVQKPGLQPFKRCPEVPPVRPPPSISPPSGLQSPKPKLAPKPNLLESIQQIQGISLGEIGESDTDVVSSTLTTTTRDAGSTTEKIRVPITQPHASLNPQGEQEHEDVYNQSVTSMGSFDTIYEDDECAQGESLTRSVDSGLGKSQIFERQPVVKRRNASKQDDAAWRKKRISTSSLTNESVLSGDSGVGSSYYTASQYGASSEASVAADTTSLNSPGSREPIYETDTVSYVSDTDSFSILGHFLKNTGQKAKIDSGIESNMESCDEHQTKSPTDLTAITEPHIVPRRTKAPPALVAREICIDLEDEIALFPDLVIRKKPCKGQHRHLNGMTCCDKLTQQDGKPNLAATHNIPKKPARKKSITKPQTVNSVLEDKTKTLVDNGTMTTNSLERRKAVNECVQTDTESYISGLSAATVKSEGCHCVAKSLDCDIQSFHSTGHISASRTPSGGAKQKRQPRLGVTAVNITRLNSSTSGTGSNRSTPALSHSRTQSGSVQSLTTGGRNSVSSLPSGPSFISNSVLSLLHDSNLLATTGSGSRERIRHSSSSSAPSGRGKGPSNVRTHHPVVQHILNMPEAQTAVLDALQTKGFLGQSSAQLVPLLKDCWLKEVTSMKDVMQRLRQGVQLPDR